MCSYLGAEAVAIDAAKARRRGVPALLKIATIVMLVADLLLLLVGCNSVTLDLGSDPNGGKLTSNDTPIVEEITWVNVTAEELIANYQQYVGKEVFLRNTTVAGKSNGSVMVASGSIRIGPNDLTIINYLAITDTIEARGIVVGQDDNGKIFIENAHINIWFSCYPREHTGNDDMGNDGTVQSDENGVPGSGWPGT